jgi:hypothetical protein
MTIHGWVTLVMVLLVVVGSDCYPIMPSLCGDDTNTELCTAPPTSAPPTPVQLPPEWWSWLVVAERLSMPLTDRPNAIVTQLHASPDIWQIDGLLDDTTCDSLIAHHAIQMADRDTLPKYCFSRTLLSDDDFTTIMNAYSINNTTDVVTSPSLWCVNGDAAQAFTRPPVNPPLDVTAAEKLSMTVSRSTLTRFGENSIVDGVERLLDSSLGLPISHAYHTQLIEYKEGQLYESHTDCVTPVAIQAPIKPHILYGDERDFLHMAARAAPLRDRLNDRAVTVLIYLNNNNDGLTGGETVFTELGISVQPRRGRALIWSSLIEHDNGTTSCDPLTRHKANPVITGTKTVYQKWYHSRPMVAIASQDMVRCDRSTSCREYIYSNNIRQANYQTLIGVTQYQQRRWGYALVCQ